MSALHQSQPLRSPAKTSLLAQWAKWTEDSTFCVTSTFILSLLIALALAYFVQPLPRVHDEFSYLLAADAFGQWETSAETHPHWQHFESFHIIHQPRYASKYPPGQGLILALGNSLGHPIIGSCLATAFALAAVMWLVIGWIDKKHHGLAMLLLSTHPGIHVIWGQSYWSGCLAMGGSALLVGSLFRLTSKPNPTHSLLAGIGTSLLMITRPFEGFVLTAVVGIVILFRFFARKEWSFSQLSSKVVLPGLTVTILAFGIVLVYNASVTGSVKSFPYQLHEDQYNWNQIFFWQGPKETKPEYRHETIAQFYENDVEEKLVNNASIVSVMSDKLNFAIVLQYLFFGSTFLLGGFGITSVLQDKRYMMPIVLIGFALGAAFLTAWKNTHYAAPAAALVLMLAIVCFFTVRERIQNRALGNAFIVFALMLHIAWFGREVHAVHQVNQLGWFKTRHDIKTKLENEPGKDLVFVRYSDSHKLNREWVYNELKIDDAEVVWAREMDDTKNQTLIDYFGDRNIWLVRPESSESLIEPYSIQIR